MKIIHRELALPLGLLDTGVCGTSNLPLPEGYGISTGKWMRMPPLHTSVVLSSGGLCSTASDLARWSHLLATGRVMLPASYATMVTPARLANNTVVPNALGVGTQKTLGHPTVGHGGAIYGFQRFLLHFPDRDVAIAVVTNAFPAPAGGEPPDGVTVTIVSTVVMPSSRTIVRANRRCSGIRAASRTAIRWRR
ncbi:MAG TPA: serine hydrolase domain-containing protein [Thermoanaerobaculia bacterium]|nr:serine hydrolase domain-containing protein [Thermoanaerobaculia bacterium]